MLSGYTVHPPRFMLQPIRGCDVKIRIMLLRGGTVSLLQFTLPEQVHRGLDDLRTALAGMGCFVMLDKLHQICGKRDGNLFGMHDGQPNQ